MSNPKGIEKLKEIEKEELELEMLEKNVNRIRNIRKNPRENR